MRAGAATTHAMANAHGHRWKATPAATRQATATTAAGTTNTGCSETSVPARSTDECSRRTARTTVPPTHRTAAIAWLFTRAHLGDRPRIGRPWPRDRDGHATWRRGYGCTRIRGGSSPRPQHVDVGCPGDDQPPRGGDGGRVLAVVELPLLTSADRVVGRDAPLSALGAEIGNVHVLADDHRRRQGAVGEVVRPEHRPGARVQRRERAVEARHVDAPVGHRR